MASVRILGWLAILAATGWAGSAWRPPVDPLAGLAGVRGATYDTVGGLPLKLDLLLPGPPDGRRLPLVIAVHGGSWTGGARRAYAPQFAGLVRGGVAVAAIDYRPARPGAPSWDGCLADVLAAVDWLLARADRYGLDPRRVAVIGSSAGGLLAARAAQRDGRIAAAVCFSTPTSLPELVASRGLRHDPVRIFLGSDPAQDPATAAEASPREHVARGGPVMLLVHGDEDRWIPIDQAREMLEKLKGVDEGNRLIVLPGTRHGFELQVGPPVLRDLTSNVRGFLDEAWSVRTAD